MKIVDMIDAMGVPWFLDDDDPKHVVRPGLPRKVGDAPGFGADIVLVDGVATVRCTEPPGSDALHEALHCMLGTDSFTCEGMLMVAQRACIEAATVGRELAELLVDFSNFSLADGEYIGTDGLAFRTKEWRSMERNAIRCGFVARRRRTTVAVWGLGVHPSMNQTWLEVHGLLSPLRGPANGPDHPTGEDERWMS